MKFVLFLLALICIAFVANAQLASKFIDPFTTDTTFNPAEGTDGATTFASSAMGGFTHIQIERTERSIGDMEIFGNSLTFNNPASAFSNLYAIYAGDQNAVKPCPVGTILSACTPSPVTSGNGLDENISEFSQLAFAIIFKDLATNLNIGVRLWFANGQTGYVERSYSQAVASGPGTKPVLTFPLSAFGGHHLTSNLQAAALSLELPSGSVDTTIGPLELIGSQVTKTADSLTLQPSGSVEFTIDVFLPVVTPLAGFTYDVDNSFTTDLVITDTLDSEFNPVTSIPTITGAGSASTSFSNNGNTFTVNINGIQSSASKVTLVYSSSVGGTSDSCQKNICNTADVSVTSTSNFVGTATASQDFNNNQVCIDYTSQPVLGLTLNGCPAFSATPQTSVTVSNTGVGPANNVVFNHTVLTDQGSNTACSVTSYQVGNQPAVNNPTCNAGVCQVTIASLAAGTSEDIVFNFDCSSFVNKCGTVTFPVVVSANDDCGQQQVSTPACQLSETYSSTLSVSETVTSTQPAKIGDTITWSINYANNGPAVPDGFKLTKTYGENVALTPTTTGTWTCDTQSRTCTIDNPDMNAGTVEFSVVVQADFPTGPNPQSCNQVTFEATPSSCAPAQNTQACSTVEPGTPGVAVTKSAATSQYTFTIQYTSEGTGALTNLVLHEVLQQGWSISQQSVNDGWVCVSTDCNYAAESPLAKGETRSVKFIVDVDINFQNNNDKCWENQVSTSFDDSQNELDKTNNVASATIGSQCKKCCDFTCPEQNITAIAPCPQEVTCVCEVPEYHCPPCQVAIPSCSCDQCSNANNVIFGVNKKKTKTK